MPAPRTLAPLPKPKELLVTPDELATFATSLFGPEWRAPLARALYVDARTVYRWEHEVSQIPGPVLAWMQSMHRQHPLQKRKRTA